MELSSSCAKAAGAISRRCWAAKPGSFPFTVIFGDGEDGNPELTTSVDYVIEILGTDEAPTVDASTRTINYSTPTTEAERQKVENLYSLFSDSPFNDPEGSSLEFEVEPVFFSNSNRAEVTVASGGASLLGDIVNNPLTVDNQGNLNFTLAPESERICVIHSYGD